ncbi:MAG: hypothetical protein QME64_01000 [bacterium]|nr:hypothetical protein [bacterium]
MRKNILQILLGTGFILGGFNLVFAGYERPLITESAEITPYGSIEVRTGFNYLKNITLLFQSEDKKWDVIHLPTIGVSVGLGDWIEVQTDFDLIYQDNEQDNGFDVGDLKLWTKIKLLSETGTRPAVAIKFGMKLPNADNTRNFGTDESDNFGMLILSKHILGVESRLNLGIGILGNPNELSKQDDVLLYGLGFVKPIYGALNAVAEITGITNSHDGNDRSSLRAGIQLPQKWITWDIAGSIGLDDRSEDWSATAGATFAFQAFGK